MLVTQAKDGIDQVHVVPMNTNPLPAISWQSKYPIPFGVILVCRVSDRGSLLTSGTGLLGRVTTSDQSLAASPWSATGNCQAAFSSAFVMRSLQQVWDVQLTGMIDLLPDRSGD